MEHLTIFILTLAMPLGVVAAYRLYHGYKQYGRRFLFTYMVLLCLLNVSVLLSLINAYLFTNNFTRFASPSAVYAECIYRFLASLLNLVWEWVFVVFCRKLLMKKLTRLFVALYFGTGIPLLTALVFFFVYSLVTVNVIPILTLNLIDIFLVEHVVIWTIIYLLLRNRKKEDGGKQKAIRIFAWAILVSFGQVMIFSLLLLYGVISNSALVLSGTVFLLVIFGMPAFFLHQFLDAYHGPLAKKSSARNRLESLYKKYSISPREQEIIQMICMGKTNKQIEDLLYIALQTVKDHVSRIYQKTGVKNRVQLTNLFRDQ